jgi:hypothetical protein
MKMQYLCHLPSLFVLAAAIGFTAAAVGAVPARVAPPAADVSAAAPSDDMSTAVAPGTTAPGAAAPIHDYPTIARVEYVNDCIGKNGGKLAALYQCSCAIDRIANALSYDDYVEASTYAKYAALTGAGGGIFRDSEQARRLAKSFRELEAEALRGCGVSH